MIKAFIVDDEQDAITALRIMLEKFCFDVKVVGTASTVKNGITGILKVLPDVLFLDIEMKGETGFDLLKHTGNDSIMVVFTTAHEQYALQALRKGAKDYLLKPIDPDELIQAVEKVRKILDLKKNQNIPAEDTYIFVNTGTITARLKKDEVIYIKADGRYSELFCTENRKLVVCRNIGEYEAELGTLGFFRSHKSVLVNLIHVVRLKKNNEDRIEVTDGSMLPISRRKKTELMGLMADEA